MEFNARCRVENRTNKDGKEYIVIVVRVGDYQFEKFLTNEQAYILKMITSQKQGQGSDLLPFII